MPFSRQFVLAATAALGFFSPALADMSTAVMRTTRDVKGLGSPAEIIVDFWGIPHIYASDQQDAFFLQGYNAGRERLWQIDLWRKRGLGRHDRGTYAQLGPEPHRPRRSSPV
jgi:penicillin amidase